MPARSSADEHVLLAIIRLDKAEASLVIVELNGARIHGEFLFTTGVHVGIWRTRFRVHCPGSSILGRKSETCAPANEEAKRPSFPAKCRCFSYGYETG
jgi:hypothetical protein